MSIEYVHYVCLLLGVVPLGGAVDVVSRYMELSCGVSRTLSLPHNTSSSAASLFTCAAECSAHPQCTGVNHYANNETCHMFMYDVVGTCSDVTYQSDGSYIRKDKEIVCKNSGTRNPSRQSCTCPSSIDYTGTLCDAPARDCAELVSWGKDQAVLPEERTTNVIHPTNASAPFYVSCMLIYYVTRIGHKTNGSGISFHRSWQEYRDGFGDLADLTTWPWSEFWLGNEKIHLLTSQATYDLYIHIHFNNAPKKSIRYTHFSVGGEETDYRVSWTASGPEGGKPLPADALEGSTGAVSARQMAFSTYDRDNDLSVTSNCASAAGSGWWYRDCSESNLFSLTWAQEADILQFDLFIQRVGGFY